MQENIDTLYTAINVLLASLDDARKGELCRLIPNPREGNARRWMEEVIVMFGLNHLDTELSRDIERRFSDESVFKGPVFDNANGLFEAEIVLHEAKQTLLNQLITSILSYQKTLFRSSPRVMVIMYA